MVRMAALGLLLAAALVAMASAQEARIYTKDSKIFVSGVEVVFPEENNATISQMLADAAAVSSAVVSLSARSSVALAALQSADINLNASISAAGIAVSAQISQVASSLAVSTNASADRIAAVNASLRGELSAAATAQMQADNAQNALLEGLRAIVPDGARLSSAQFAAAFWASTYNKSAVDALASSLQSSLQASNASALSAAAAAATTAASVAQAAAATSTVVAALSSSVRALPATYTQTQLDAVFAGLYNRTQVDNITAALRASISSQLGQLAACNDAGQFFDPVQGMCRNVAIRLPSTPNAPCTAADIGRIRYDAVNNQLLLCNGTLWAAIVTSASTCSGTRMGFSIDCPAPSCAYVKSINPAVTSGKYFVGSVPAPLVHCDMSAGVSLGGDGTSVATASYGCPVLKKYWNVTAAGAYFIRLATGVTKLYCDMSLAGGGYMLVWKHSYFQVGAVTNNMRFFSQFDNPCTDLSDGWCNVPNKNLMGASRQMLAAYHLQSLVYAYTGTASPASDTTWQGAILNTPQMVVDLCTTANGVPPEPACSPSGVSVDNGICGITFDKFNPGAHTGNCDTDRYVASSGQDCRWENCAPSFGIRTQMTMAMFVLIPESASVALAAGIQSLSYASCAAAKLANPFAMSGPFSIAMAGGSALQWCDMTGPDVSLGGDGSSLTNPALDCNTLYRAWGKPSGTYFISTPIGIRRSYCYMDIGSGGWMLVWKHSYYEVTPTAQMTTFSQDDQPCVDLFNGWCNVPSKNNLAASEMMVAAFHAQVPIYAYSGPINPLLGVTWKGAIIPSATKVLDLCTNVPGTPPEPECGGTHAYCGITFDKFKTGDYVSNCDTDRYGDNGPDCRWENCFTATSGLAWHDQMTVGIFVRSAFGVPNATAASCRALKAANPSLPTGSYTVTLGGAPRTVYCEQSIDGGGYTLVWKQSYYQSGPVTSSMTTFSSVAMPCVDLSQSWCNEPIKGNMSASTMMLVAYNDFRPIYAYKVAYNPAIATTWTALRDFTYSTMVLDLCSNPGVPVEPACNPAMCGVTFDKATVGDYVSNCDTDRYGTAGTDCRWENCNPSFGVRVQMTMALYVK